MNWLARPRRLTHGTSNCASARKHDLHEVLFRQASTGAQAGADVGAAVGTPDASAWQHTHKMLVNSTRTTAVAIASLTQDRHIARERNSPWRTPLQARHVQHLAAGVPGWAADCQRAHGRGEVLGLVSRGALTKNQPLDQFEARACLLRFKCSHWVRLRHGQVPQGQVQALDRSVCMRSGMRSELHTRTYATSNELIDPAHHIVCDEQLNELMDPSLHMNPQRRGHNFAAD
jgi:hypothetical protein